MSDYRVDAATKEEWAERAMKAEARLKDVEERYSYIEDVWNDLYGTITQQRHSMESMAARFQTIKDTNTEQYLDVLEEFVEYMEKAPIYKRPK